jgi:hypothetical protein
MGKIKPSINPKGYTTAVKDYSETSVIEEIAANSYDAYASTTLFLLDEINSRLYVYDDGTGFNNEAMTEMLTLGGGKKAELFAKSGARVYLGSYGFGFKAVVNIAKEIHLNTCSEQDKKMYTTTIDLSDFEDRMKANSEGYDFEESSLPNKNSKGTIIRIKLKNPTTKKNLDQYINVLGNLPNENGAFNCYCGHFANCANSMESFLNDFFGLQEIVKQLQENGKIQLVSNLIDSELDACQEFKASDKDNNTTATIYFAGMNGGKPITLKESLRGVYIRVHGRLLKADFSTDKYTKNITKYIQFKSSMRAEFSIDWLRSEITLSRDGINFSNDQLESVFKKTLQKVLGQFCQKQYELVETARKKAGDKRLVRREELARKRVSKSADVVIKDVKAGFIFKPDSDAELAMLISQDYIMNKINPNYQLIDYNSSEPFDCMIYDKSRDEFIYSELEPTIINFLEHRNKDNIRLIIVWALGGWKLSHSRKKGKDGWFELNHPADSPKGHYKLLQFASESGIKFKKTYPVIVVNEILK